MVSCPRCPVAPVTTMVMMRLPFERVVRRLAFTSTWTHSQNFPIAGTHLLVS